MQQLDGQSLAVVQSCRQMIASSALGTLLHLNSSQQAGSEAPHAVPTEPQLHQRASEQNPVLEFVNS